jgi:hypothetical protein
MPTWTKGLNKAIFAAGPQFFPPFSVQLTDSSAIRANFSGYANPTLQLIPLSCIDSCQSAADFLPESGGRGSTADR